MINIICKDIWFGVTPKKVKDLKLKYVIYYLSEMRLVSNIPFTYQKGIFKTD